VCPTKLIKERDSLESNIKRVWNYCDIKIISNNELRKFSGNKNSSFFNLGTSADGVAMIVFMELWMVRDPSKKMDDLNRKQFARFGVHLDCKIGEVWGSSNNDDIFNYLDRTADIVNFKSGIICTYLKLIQTTLLKKESIVCQGEITNKEELKKLKTQTIYITESILKSKNCNGDNPLEEDKLMKEYHYEYKIITFKELNKKLLLGEDFYYLMALKPGYQGREFTIYNSITGNCIYNRHYVGSDFKYGDFASLEKLINK
jgi:hypothetical protein